MTQNGLPAEVASRKRHTVVTVEPVDNCEDCGEFMAADGSHECSDELKQVQAFFIASGMSEVDKLKAAGDVKTSPAMLSVLAQHGDDDMKMSVAGNTSTSPGTLAALAKSDDEGIVVSVSENTSTSPGTLAALAKSDDDEMVALVAGNTSTSPETLAALALHDNYAVEEKVGENPSTSPATLALMVADLDDEWKSEIHLAVAGNPSTPLESLLLLAESDEDYGIYSDAREGSILQAVRRNDSAELDAYKKAHHYSFDRLYPDVSIHDEGHERELMANSSDDADDLESYSSDSNSIVRRAVADNEFTSTETLKDLTRDEDEYVRDGATEALASRK